LRRRSAVRGAGPSTAGLRRPRNARGPCRRGTRPWPGGSGHRRGPWSPAPAPPPATTRPEDVLLGLARASGRPAPAGRGSARQAPCLAPPCSARSGRFQEPWPPVARRLACAPGTPPERRKSGHPRRPGSGNRWLRYPLHPGVLGGVHASRLTRLKHILWGWSRGRGPSVRALGLSTAALPRRSHTGRRPGAPPDAGPARFAG